MATPFSLERLASKVDLAGKKARQTYFNKRADEATKYLSDLLDSMQKHAKKETGIFQGKFGKLGKAALSIGLGAIPGVGPALSLALNAADLAKSQKDYASRIKSMSGDFNIPSKYKGTFMEDYLIGGAEAGRSNLKSFFKGSKDTDLLTGLISLIPQALSVGQSLSAAKDVVSTTGSAGGSIIDQGGLSSIEVAPGVETVTKSNLGKLLSGIGKIGVPYTGLNMQNFADPLAQSGGPLLKSLTTPGTYTPVLQNLLMDYLKQGREEPIVTRLQAPKAY